MGGSSLEHFYCSKRNARGNTVPSNRAALCPRYNGSLFIIFLFILIAAKLTAQTNEEINAGVQFNLSPPGAKNLALGGAFTGLADDATAAYSNPAGLLWIEQDEFFLEVKSQSFRTNYPFGGSASGEPTGIGIDNIPNLEIRTFESRTTDLSFISYVRKLSSRWRIAFFHHQLANYKASVKSEGPFIRSGGTQPALNRSRLAPIAGDLRLSIESNGVALALGAFDKRISLGLNLTYQQLDLASQTRRFSVAGEVLPDGRSETFFGPADFSEASLSERSIQQSDDGSFAASFGFLYRNRRETLAFGLAARMAPEFELGYEFRWEAQNILRAVETGNANFVDPGVVRALSGTTSFSPPAVYTTGVYLRPKVLDRRLAFTLDLALLRFSNLTPRKNTLTSTLRGAPTPGTSRDLSSRACGDFSPNGNRYPTGEGDSRPSVPCISPTLGNFNIDDALEIHFGIQYKMPKAMGNHLGLELRFGSWFEPDHQLHYDIRNIDIRRSEDRFAFRFPKGKDVLHLTAGLGVEVTRSNAQEGSSFWLDFGIDTSDRGTAIAISFWKGISAGAE